LGDPGRQSRCCYGRHALAGKLQGAEDKAAEVPITKKLVLFGCCAAETMVHVEPQGSPNRVVKERRPFLLVLYDKNCVCKLQSIEEDKAQRNKRRAGDYMEFSAKGPLCEQYRLATGGLVARLDHKVKCTFFAAISMTVDTT
jgi:hypothetical protein